MIRLHRFVNMQLSGLAALTVALVGCRSPEPSCINRYFLESTYSFDASPPPGASRRDSFADASDVDSSEPESAGARSAGDPKNEGRLPPPNEPLRLPPGLPGADVPPLRLPPLPSDATDAERRDVIRGLYPPLPVVDELPAWQVGLNERPLTLGVLQELALENSPVLRQASADVEVARGAMIQAGRPPNPSLGYQADTVRTANTNGYHGGYVQQTFVTAGKLRLAQEAAMVDLQNARISLRKARVEVASDVRANYFAAIVAREQLRLAEALAQFIEQIYETQIDLVEGGESAPYEPMQLRVLTLQSQANIVQAQREYESQWRQLAASLGLPDLPPTELAGSPDMPAPVIRYDQALALMLANHTDLAIAANSVGQARLLLRLAQVTPVPNVDAYVAVQHDYTFDPGTTTYNLQFGGDFPVLNRNRGNIISAQAQVYRAEQTIAQVRNDLTRGLADAFARYDASRVLLSSFRAQALRDQVRAYRGVYERYRNDPVGVQFNDVVVAQQVLAEALTQYVNDLGSQWQAVVELGRLTQVDDIYTLGVGTRDAPLPDLETLRTEELLPPLP